MYLRILHITLSTVTLKQWLLQDLDLFKLSICDVVNDSVTTSTSCVGGSSSSSFVEDLEDDTSNLLGVVIILLLDLVVK